MRTTGVRLIAETGLFKREMRDSARETRKVKEELDDTRVSGEKLGDGLTKAGKAGRVAVDEMRRTVAGLDKEVADAEKTLNSLVKSFARSGDMGVVKQIREQQARLKELKNVRALLPDAAEIAKAGAGVGASLLGGIRGTLSSATPASIGVAALGLLVAGTLSAAVSGAVVGGLGVGGVIGGVALAARDERVKDAGKDLGRFLLSDLENRSAGFVDPVLKSIERIRSGFVSMGPDLDKIFGSSRFVEPLTDGLMKGARGLVSGIADAIENADPVIYAFRNMFSEIGRATGDMFRSMAEDADEGASAINDVTRAITGMIDVTSTVVSAGASVHQFGKEVNRVGNHVRYWIEDNSALAENLKIFGKQLDLTNDGFSVGTAEAESYRKVTLGTAEAADFARLKQAGMTDAQIAAVDHAGKYRGELEKLVVATRASADAAGTLIANTDDVKEKQQEATVAQQNYTKSIELMAPGAQRATMLVDGLKKATQGLYDTQMQAVEANESYEASWDALSESVKRNKGSLDIHTAAGRSNRDALQALLISSREMYYADINAGMAIDDARKKHEKRTVAVREESRRVGLNKTETDKMITTYGRIPGKKQTDVILDGVNTVVKKLMDLYVYQRSLAEGLPVGSVIALLKNEKAGPAKRYGGYHDGGHTGSGGEYEPAGVVHRDEFVIRKRSRRKIEAANPGLLDEMNATGQLPGYAGGGLIAPVETRGLRYRINVQKTKIPSRAKVAADVFSFDGGIPYTGGSFGGWPSSPSAQRGDSGVWRKVLGLIKSGPRQGSFGNAYRPGDPKWHGSGRAVDWMGYNMDALASYLASKRPLELIHRTNRRDYAYTRGRNKGSFSEGLMNAHRNHIHIAMKDGGVIREPIVGVGRSGATYSFGEGGIHERVTPMGRGSSSTGGGRPIQITIHNHVATGVSAVEVGRQTAEHLGRYFSAGGSVMVNGKAVLP